ncbi:MAG: DUF4383 domain-containing protein [Candidatus Thermoplasmatota archaeon]|jgi:hypothetical protein
MSDYATSTTNRNPVMNPTVYWRVSAFALTAVALLGIVLNAMNEGTLLGADFLAFDWSHNILHVVLAGAAFLFGFGNLPANLVRTFAIVFGVVYAGLGVLGFFISEVGPIHLEIGENLVHLLLGAWGLVAGFGSKT